MLTHLTGVLGRLHEEFSDVCAALVLKAKDDPLLQSKVPSILKQKDALADFLAILRTSIAIGEGKTIENYDDGADRHNMDAIVDTALSHQDAAKCALKCLKSFF